VWKFDGDDKSGWHAVNVETIDANRTIHFKSAVTGAAGTLDLDGDRIIPETARDDAAEFSDPGDEGYGSGGGGGGGGGRSKSGSKKKKGKAKKGMWLFAWTKFLTVNGRHSRWNAGSTPIGHQRSQSNTEVRRHCCL